MNEIEIALDYARKTKIKRLKQNKMYRCKARANCLSTLSISDRYVNESPMEKPISKNAPLSNEESSCDANLLCVEPLNSDKEKQISELIVSSTLNYQYSDFYDIFIHPEVYNMNLHPYTNVGCFSFATDLISFIRKTNISKTHANNLITLIRSVLPQPNTLPKNYAEMLNFVSVENLFIKRTTCILCKRDLLESSKTCSHCSNTSSKSLAIIIDSIQENFFTQVYDRLRFIINAYVERFTSEIDSPINDIPFNKNYRSFRNSIKQPFISIILHVDGINFDKSKRHHLWVFSCSIVELPPDVRNQRNNNIILSLWICKEQPDIDLWLNRCFSQMKHLKINGFPLRSGSRMMVKIYGIIGDTPALNMIRNHKGHGGYNCCWYCHIKGLYIGKMQYYYDGNIALRNEIDFADDSRTAQYLKTTVNGRHGISILEKIIDVPLPRAIIVDYLHVTLLGHAKAICLYIYKNYMKPKARIEFNEKISGQRFPHFFNRKIRSFEESYLKATEIRNMFLFCLLPMIRNILDYDVLGHVALFVIGIRLLHGRPEFGHQTADMAHNLLLAFYRDHEKFYIGLQNFVLHIHCHFAELYRNHGSLCNINTFSQEDFMGAVSKCKNGTNYWAQQLIFYLNIDFALRYGKKYSEPMSSISISKGVYDNITTPDEVVQILPNIHSSLCTCPNTDCIQFYSRFRNENEVVYHSLAYKKRQLSISYFIKYGTLFGSIMVFMRCNNKEYAIVNRHMVKNSFSDYFISSFYYNLISKPIDSFFFVLKNKPSRLDVIDVQSSMDMCIVMEEDDCFVVSPLSVYHEHD